jgi:predicted PurR-regulated permease PerM
MEQLVNDVARWLGDIGVGQKQIDQIAGAFDVGKVVSVVGQLVSGLLGALSSLFLVVTLILFMVADAARVPERMLRLAPEHRPMTDALASFASGTRRYLVVSTVFGLIVAVCDVFALIWLGVPLAIVWGLLSFITNYIPNIGFVIGVIPPAILGLLVGGPGTLLAVIVAYSVLNVLIQTVIQPKIVGDAVGLTGTITMISLVFWAYALGAIGALMAVPLTLLSKAVLVDADPRSAWMVPLISGKAEGRGAGKDGRHPRRRPWRRRLP